MAGLPNSPAILLADSDLSAREAVAKLLSRPGWTIDLVTSGSEVLEALKRRKYDIVITDLVIPGVAGLELLRQIRKEKSDQAIIVMGSFCSADSLVAVQKEGAHECLLKPVDLVSLEQAIERSLQSGEHLASGRWGEHFFTEQKLTFTFLTRDLAKVAVPFGVTDMLVINHRLSRELKLKIELALQEAITNSLDHGNLELESVWKEEVDDRGVDRYATEKKKRLVDSNYSNRKVVLSVECDRSSMIFRVKDEGRGFDYTSLEERIETLARLGKVHGRGIALISSVMDKVSYECGGRELVMFKQLPVVGKRS